MIDSRPSGSELPDEIGPPLLAGDAALMALAMTGSAQLKRSRRTKGRGTEGPVPYKI